MTSTNSEEGHRDDAGGNARSPQFRIIGGLSIRFAEGEGRNDDAFRLRLSDSDREWVVTGLAAAGASSGRDVT